MTVLFIQATEPAGYPPLINAAWLFAEEGRRVHFLGAPIAGMQLELPCHPRITRTDIQVRPTHVMTMRSYAAYCAQAAALARRLKPDIVYASDPTGALPGLIAARAAGARLVYHEHDSPNGKHDLNSLIAWARRTASRQADVIVFPNEARAASARRQLGFASDRLHVVWNMPRRDETPDPVQRPDQPLIVYYHGTVVPDRLPTAVPKALQALERPVVLRIAGYETASGNGYIAALEKEYGRAREGGLVDYVGEVPRRDELLRRAAAAHIGLALVPMSSADINMQHMTGASNKPFDYMAAGLPFLVSDLPDWRRTFVEPKHAMAADSRSPKDIAAALTAYMERPKLRCETGIFNRNKIVTAWNYETAFSSVMQNL